MLRSPQPLPSIQTVVPQHFHLLIQFFPPTLFTLTLPSDLTLLYPLLFISCLFIPMFWLFVQVNTNTTTNNDPRTRTLAKPSMGHWHMVNPQRHFLPFSFKQAPATKWPAHNTGTTRVPCFVTGTLYVFDSQMQHFPFRLLVLFTKAHLQVNLCYLSFFFLRHIPAH